MTQVLLGALAVGLGALLAGLAFVPYVIVTIRRHGSFGVRRALTSFAFLVYAVAIWTYTLLPMPLPSEVRCAGVDLDPLAFVDDIAGAVARGHPLTDVAVLQLALNVLLFVPLGVFIRLFWRRGVVVAGAAGLALSLPIETTQLTGVWGLYECACRVFDVDDLLTNTLGAVVGSLLSLGLPRAWRLSAADAAEAARPRAITRRRRLLAMIVDLAGTTLLLSTVSGTLSLAVLLIGGRDALLAADATIATISAVIVLAATGIITVATGFTLGDAAVRLAYRGGPFPAPFARLLRFAGGIGGAQVLWIVVPDSLWTGVFVAASVVALLATPTGRGLPGLLSAQRLEDARS